MSKFTAIICVAHYDEEKVERQTCAHCRSEQLFLCQHEEWYGWTETCLNCGDSWMDGELCPRPFERGWREKSATDARKRAIEKGLLKE